MRTVKRELGSETNADGHGQDKNHQQPKRLEEDISSEIRVGLGRAELTSDGFLAVAVSLPTWGGDTNMD